MFADEQIHLYLIPLQASQPAQLVYRQLLSCEERARADRLVHLAHRQRWLIGRARLRHILADYCGIAPREVEFVYSQKGKPELSAACQQTAGMPEIYFNFSHSGDMALLAVTPVAPIGIDIEKEREIRDWSLITRRFFSVVEQRQLEQLEMSVRRHAFYCAWTRKEAIIKATGEGLSANLAGFDVTLTPGNPAAVLSYGGSVAEGRRWQLHHWVPQPGYVAAIALKMDGTPGIKHQTYCADKYEHMDVVG